MQYARSKFVQIYRYSRPCHKVSFGCKIYVHAFTFGKSMEREHRKKMENKNTQIRVLYLSKCMQDAPKMFGVMWFYWQYQYAN